MLCLPLLDLELLVVSPFLLFKVDLCLLLRDIHLWRLEFLNLFVAVSRSLHSEGDLFEFARGHLEPLVSLEGSQVTL